MGTLHQSAVLEPQWEHPLDVQEPLVQEHSVRHKPRSMMYDLKTRQHTQVQTWLDQSEKDSISLSLIRKIRANHLGSNLRLGAEAQLANHAIQTSQQ